MTFSQQSKKVTTRIDSVNVLQQIIRNGQMVSTQGLGYAGVPSRQWYSFAFLINISTSDELLEMTKDSSACLRLYSYIGLFYFKDPQIDQVHKYLSIDTTKIRSFEGCVFDYTTINKAINQINIWCVESQLTKFSQDIQTDKHYRNRLFTEIVNNKKIHEYKRL